MTKSANSKLLRMKVAEIEQLKSQVRTLRSISRGIDDFVVRAANSYNVLLRLQTEHEVFKESANLVSEPVSILRALEWSNPEDWPPSVYFEIRQALREAISVMARAERSYRASSVRNQQKLIRQARSQLKTANTTIDVMCRRMEFIQSTIQALSDHLANLRTSNSFKRQFIRCELDGKRLSNTPSNIERMIRDHETTVSEIQTSVDLDRTLVEQLDSEIKVINKNLEDLSKDSLAIESLEAELPFFADFLKLMPTRFQTSTKPLSQVVAEEVAIAKTRISFLNSDDSNSELERRLEAATKRKEREADRARKELEEVAKETARRSLAELRRAERYVESNSGLEIEISKKEKAANSLNRRLTRSRTQLANLESQIDLSIEGLWLRNRWKRVHTSRGFLEIDSPAFFESNLALYPALANRLQRKKDLERAITLLRQEEVSVARALRTLQERAKKVRQMEALLKRGLPRSAPGSKRPRRVVTEWTHAEELVRDFMVYLGFHDARLTKAGADGGVDVSSRKAVAQVKMHNRGVPSYDIQKLVGIASVEGKIPLFFAMSYSREAKSWSNEYGIALFCFDRSGDVVAISEKARSIELGAK